MSIESSRSHGERGPGRIQAQGCRTDDGTEHTLLVVHEADGPWTIHGLGDIGIGLTKERMVVLAQAVLERAR